VLNPLFFIKYLGEYLLSFMQAILLPSSSSSAKPSRSRV